MVDEMNKRRNVILTVILFFFLSFGAGILASKTPFLRGNGFLGSEKVGTVVSPAPGQNPAVVTCVSPSVSPTVTPADTIMPTAEVTPTPEIKIVYKYITVTPKPTHIPTPTPTPVPVNVMWALSSDGTYEICRFPGAGANLNVLEVKRAYGSPVEINERTLTKTRDATAEPGYWEDIYGDPINTPLGGSCYSMSVTDGMTYTYSFSQYQYTLDNTFTFQGFLGHTVTNDTPSMDDYNIEIPEGSWTPWILLNEPG